MTNARNNVVDALRLIAALLIVLIHVVPVIEIARSYELIYFLTATGRIAVPLFFALSGYFLFSNKKTEIPARALSQAKRIGLIFLGSAALYFIFNLIVDRVPYFPDKNLFFKFIMFGQTGFLSGPLWFLLALVVVNVIFYLIFKYFKSEKILAISSILIFFVLICTQPYANEAGFRGFAAPTDLVHSWIYAIPFFYLGFLLNRYSSLISKISKRNTLILLFVALGIYLYEYCILSEAPFLGFGPKGYQIYLTLPLVVASIIAISNKFTIPDSFISRWGRKYSLYIYIIHDMVIYTLLMLVVSLNRNIDNLKEILGFWIITCLISLITAAMYVNVKSKLPQILKNAQRLYK